MTVSSTERRLKTAKTANSDIARRETLKMRTESAKNARFANARERHITPHIGARLLQPPLPEAAQNGSKNQPMHSSR